MGAIVIDSTKEKNEELKKKWSKVNKVSETLTSISSSGFIISLLSPFDFEGPVIEIVTAAVAAVGFILKKVSESKLDKLEDNILDKEDKDTLLNISENLGKIVLSDNNTKKR